MVWTHPLPGQLAEVDVLVGTGVDVRSGVAVGSGVFVSTGVLAAVAVGVTDLMGVGVRVGRGASAESADDPASVDPTREKLLALGCPVEAPTVMPGCPSATASAARITMPLTARRLITTTLPQIVMSSRTR
jgi:hypothetical protein